MFLKLFNKLTGRVLLGLKPHGFASWLYTPIKHSRSFIKHIMTWAFYCDDLSAHGEKAEILVIQTKQNNNVEITLVVRHFCINYDSNKSISQSLMLL